MKKLITSLVAVLFVVFLSSCMDAQKDIYGLADKTHSAVTPVSSYRMKEKWAIERHEQILKHVAHGNVDLIFVGDSITHAFEKERRGKKVWDQYYVKRNALNLGYSSDRTQNVLWRFDHGEIDGISPKLAVLMIGTNNSEDNTAEEIADGIKAVCVKVMKKMPKTKILILAIFPRGDRQQRQNKKEDAVFNLQWAKNNEASKLASKIADDKIIYYLDINQVFLTEDGVLSRKIMGDLLHPNTRGYRIWAEAIEPTVKNLMGENDTGNN